jgi:hypothetical protein
MSRVIILVLCAVLGVVASGVVLAIIVPVTSGRISQPAALAVGAGCVVVSVALGVNATRRRRGD